MTSSRVLKCANCNVVINEVLSFVCNKIDVMDEESISRICVSAFTEEDIKQAKGLLFESVPTTKRNIKRKREKKTTRDIEDIICLLKETDPDVTPIFVARDLQKLPPVLFDHVDVTRLLKDLLWMQNEIKFMKEQYATVQQLDHIKGELELLKTTSIVNLPHVNTEGVCMVDASELDRGNLTTNTYNTSYNTILSVPNSPIINSSPVEGRHEKRCVSEKTETEPSVVNTASVNNNRRKISSGPSAASMLQRAGVLAARHTAAPNIVPNIDCIYANTLNNGEITLPTRQSESKGEWTLVQKKKRFQGNKGKAAVKPEGRFKAADIKIPMYIYNVDKNVSKEDIITYIKEKSNLCVQVEKMKMKVAKD